MATATPPELPFEDFGPVDEAYLAALPPELREQFEETGRRFAAGEVQPVPHAEIEAALARQRRAALKAG